MISVRPKKRIGAVEAQARNDCLFESRLTIFVADRLADGYTSLLIRILKHHDLGKLDAQTAPFMISSDSINRVQGVRTDQPPLLQAQGGCCQSTA
jgi:hypothetical protein